MSAATKTLRAWLVAAALTTGAAACSLILDFDENERPCAPDGDDLDTVGDCIDGYSCMVNVCVKDGSIPEGSTCWVNAHCEPGHVCTTDPFACRERCGNLAYGNNSACPSDRACVRKSDSDGRAIAACVPNGCAADTGCDPPGDFGSGVCVPVTPNVSVCERACDVNCSGGVCSGNCGLDEERRQLACQPVGMDHDLACILEGEGKHGESCNLVDDLCDAHSACIMAADGSSGVCMAYCDATAGAADACASHSDLVTGDSAVCAEVPDTSFSVCGEIPTQLQ